MPRGKEQCTVTVGSERTERCRLPLQRGCAELGGLITVPQVLVHLREKVERARVRLLERRRGVTLLPLHLRQRLATGGAGRTHLDRAVHFAGSFQPRQRRVALV